MHLPNIKAAMLVYPSRDEGYKLLREKYKCGAQEAHALVRDYLNHIFDEWPKDRIMKNPRRKFIHGLRGWLPRFMNYAVWRAEKGEGTLEVALFPRPLLTSKDVNLKTMLSDLVTLRGKAGECSSGGLWFARDYHMGSLR